MCLSTDEKVLLLYWICADRTSTLLCGMTRLYRCISLPKGMFVTCYDGGEHQVSRVKTLGLGVPLRIQCTARSYELEISFSTRSARRERSGGGDCAKYWAWPADGRRIH